MRYCFAGVLRLWGCPGQTIETSAELVQDQNTLSIAAHCPEQTTAATIYLTSENGGYRLENLPSKDELKQIAELHTELELFSMGHFAMLIGVLATFMEMVAILSTLKSKTLLGDKIFLVDGKERT